MPLTRNLFYVTPAHNFTPVRNLSLWLLHVALVQLNSICGVELIEYLFTILPKRNFFGARKTRSINTWRIIWLFLFTLSISLNQASMFVIRLTIL